MIKKCIKCNNDYESTQKSGQEQKYCSKTCRNKAANERRENDMAEKFKREFLKEPDARNEERRIFENVKENNTTNYGQNFGLSAEKIFELVSANANMSADNKRLQDKIQDLEIKVGTLTSELDEYDNEDESQMGGIGKIAEQYAPVLIPMIANLFKPNQQNNQPQQNAKTKAA